MADKAAIELGQRLNRLMANEDFAPFLDELSSRIANRKAQLTASATVYDYPQHITSNLAQRLDELSAIREWIDDSIEYGGREILKQQTQDALEAEGEAVPT